MPELTREEKIKIFERLPRELQNLMESEDTGAFLLYLGEKYNLDDDKVSFLSRLVGDVILGITPVTSLAQEINLKITTDHQIAMNLSQELYADLLSPVISGVKLPATQTMPTPQTPFLSPATKIPTPRVEAPTQIERNVGADRYRESINGTPGIVDLRKTQLPVRTAPIPVPLTPPIPKPTPPLTFTKPVEPAKPMPLTPLIEAEPHRQQQPPMPPAEKPVTNILRPPVLGQIKPPVANPSAPLRTSEAKPPVVSGVEPQYIIRPPGLAPTDLPRNILDLKRDKGEF